MQVQIQPQIDGGMDTFHLASAATTNAMNIKPTAGQVFGWYIYNNAAFSRKVNFYNTGIVPVVGVSPILFALVIPPNSAANAFTNIGIQFGLGIGLSITVGVADTDATAVALNDCIINIFYK